MKTEWTYPNALIVGAMVITALLVIAYWGSRRASKTSSEFAELAEDEMPLASFNGIKRIIRGGLLVLSIGLCAVVLARPYSSGDWSDATTRSIDIAVLIDVSRSMTATDVSPSRLERSKLAVEKLFESSPRDRFAIVPFAGTAFVQCPLTHDQTALKESLDLISTESIPYHGTRLGEALKIAASAFDEDDTQHRAIIILSDGEEHDEGGEEAAKQLREDGFTIFAIGVGTSKGALLTETSGGQTTYFKDSEGQPVRSMLEPDLLRGIATVGGGFYLELTTPETIRALIRQGLEPLPRVQKNTTRLQQQDEHYQWPLLFLCITLSIFLLMRDLPNRMRRNSATASFLVMIILSGAASTQASASSVESREMIAEGLTLLEGKDWNGAAEQFDNATATLELPLQHKAFYNLGYARFQQALKAEDLNEKYKWLEASETGFKTALELNPASRATAKNLVLTRRHLQTLKEQVQEQQQQQESQDSDQQQSEDQSDQQESGEQQQDSEEGEQEENSQDGEQQQPSDEDPQKGSESKSTGEEGEQGKEDSEDATDGDGEEEGAKNGKDSKGGEPQGMTLLQALEFLNHESQRPRALPIIPNPPEDQGEGGKDKFKTW